jgi:hypothetical protein
LKLDGPGDFAGTIGNLSLGDTIELKNFYLRKATGSSLVAHTKINGTTLTVTMDNGRTLTLQLGAGNYSGNAFTVQNLPPGEGQKFSEVGLRFANASPSINTNVPGSGYNNPYIDSLLKFDAA